MSKVIKWDQLDGRIKKVNHKVTTVNGLEAIGFHTELDSGLSYFVGWVYPEDRKRFSDHICYYNGKVVSDEEFMALANIS